MHLTKKFIITSSVEEIGTFKRARPQWFSWNKHSLQLFSRINHRLLIIMDGFKKCCEINTISLTCGFLQVRPWNNDIIMEKMDGWEWCCHKTNFFEYIHVWNQGGIIIIFIISLLQFLFWKNTVYLKESVTAITLLQ